MAAEELFRGTLTQTSVYPKEIVKSALRHNAAAVIFAHNHPSGVAEPSRADEMLTISLKQALALVDIKVPDHFIVAGGAAVSAGLPDRPLPAVHGLPIERGFNGDLGSGGSEKQDP